MAFNPFDSERKPPENAALRRAIAKLASDPTPESRDQSLAVHSVACVTTAVRASSLAAARSRLLGFPPERPPGRSTPAGRSAIGSSSGSSP